MTKTYASIVKQIEVLKIDAEKARRKEVDGVISRIRSAIDAYELTAEDLGFSTKAKGPKKPAVKTKVRRKGAAKSPIVVKFRNDSGGTWGGRGKRPQWLRDAINSGRSLADFAVK